MDGGIKINQTEITIFEQQVKKNNRIIEFLTRENKFMKIKIASHYEEEEELEDFMPGEH